MLMSKCHTTAPDDEEEEEAVTAESSTVVKSNPKKTTTTQSLTGTESETVRQWLVATEMGYSLVKTRSGPSE